MKKDVGCLLLALMLLTTVQNVAEAQELTVSDVWNSGCTAGSRGEEEYNDQIPEPVPTIILMKQGSVLSVEVQNYESNCATAGFHVEASLGEGRDGAPCSVNVSVTPYVPGDLYADCMCPYIVSFTLHNLEANTFYLKCWWYEGLVTLKEGESLVLSEFSSNIQNRMLKEGKSWIYSCHHFEERETNEGVIFDEEVFDVSYTIKGDTVIGGITYAKLMEHQKGSVKYYGGVREEGSTIFCVNSGTSDEYVLLEFDPSKFFAAGIYGKYDEHKEIIKVNDIYYIRHVYEPVNEHEHPRLIGVEGIGFNGCGLVLGMEDVQPTYFGSYMSFKACYEDDKLIFSSNNFNAPTLTGICDTPTIAYDKGKLVFSCETPGAECVYEISCSDNGSGRGGEVSLSQTYEIRVHAIFDGYEDSDVATAIIGWRNGQPVMEGFSSVTLGDDELRGDVNGDGIVDVADIATVISIIAAQKSE